MPGVVCSIELHNLPIYWWRHCVVCLQQADTTKTPNKNNEDCLDPDEFTKFYKILTKREEIDDLFRK